MTLEQALCVGIIGDGLRRAHQAAGKVAAGWGPHWEVNVGLKHFSRDDPGFRRVTIENVGAMSVVVTLTCGDREASAAASVQDTAATMVAAFEVAAKRLSQPAMSATAWRG
jgi:hypothetical protein